MKPQRKPFVVEIRKAKQFYRKPVSAGGNRPDSAPRAEVRAKVGLSVRSEERN